MSTRPGVEYCKLSGNEGSECVEENELLNGHGSRTSIKMHDAPFDSSRSGSEEDMLEYDDEPMFSCTLCNRRRRCTATEKGLIGFGLLCLVIIIILAVRLGHKEEPKVYKTCESKDCLQAASSIISAMDPTADPCRDFHQYACGGWLKETPIPPGYPIWNRFQELSHKNLYVLKNLIETHNLYGEAQHKVKTFFKSCMEESKVPREKTLDDFRFLLSNVSNKDKEFNFPSSLVEAHRLNTWPLFQLLVGPDERNPDKNIIKIEAGVSIFPHGVFKVAVRKSVNERSSGMPPNTTEKSITVPSDNEQDNNTDVDLSSLTNDTNTGYKVVTKAPITATPTPSIKDTHPHPTENISNLVKTYLEDTTVLIQSLWKKTRQEAENEAQLILELERRLSLAHDIDLHIHNRTQAYNGMTIKALQTKCNMFDWTRYFQGVLKTSSRPITNRNEIIVLHEDALLRVCNIVAEYNQNTTVQSILRSYILLSVARSLKPFFDIVTFDGSFDPEEEIELEGEHWRRCAFYANKALGFASGSIYVSGTSAEKSVNQGDGRVVAVKNLVEYVKKAFKDYLLRKIWLDPKTKKNAAIKIDEMIDKVSYPSYILNITFLDDFYKQFVIGQDWFRNLLNWREFVIRKMESALHEKYDRAHSWINPPVTVESDYSPVRNDIIFPIALFDLPIFSLEGPSAMNFGAMGSLIGHEITHAFDIQGRQYDGYGRLRDWWDPVTASMFNETTFCMKDQYDRMKVGNFTINGEQTLDENIADNGGLRAAQMAYELWVHEHGEDAPLPGVSLTNHQIFYISFAQLYCSKWKEEGMEDFLLRDSHSPGPYRIKGALSNSLLFQDVFECSYTSKYNPATKCRVW